MNDDLIELEKILLDPSTRRSAKKIDEYLTDDFVEFGSSGKVYSKKDIIERLPKEESFSFEARSFKTKKLTNSVVLVTYIINIDGSNSLRSSIWLNDNGKWKMTFHQGTKL